MSSRRDAIVGKFRAGSLDRLRKLSVALVELAEGRAPSEQAAQVARELHTLKGEATMLNFAALGELVHEAEECLARAKGEELLRQLAARRILVALQTVREWLRGELGEGEQGDGGLRAALQPLKAPLEMGAAADLELSAELASPEPANEKAPAAAAPGAAPKDQLRQRWVQVNARRIDDFSERVAGFEAEFKALLLKLRDHAKGSQDASGSRALRPLITDFDRCEASLQDITSAAWALRLVPVEPALEELVGYARGLAARQGKRVRFAVSGGNAQIERTVLDSLQEPLVHLVRNAIDHGIEARDERTTKGEALVSIGAEAHGPNVILTIADDGRGIDRAKVRAAAVERGMLDADAADKLPDADVLELLFLQGLTTRSAVTDVSGRGVGLDVVRSSVEACGGSVSVASERGRGTRFQINVPATITKEKNLVVDVGGSLYAIPSRAVTSVVRLLDCETERVAGGTALRFGAEAIPFGSLRTALGTSAGGDEAWAIVVESARHRWAFACDKPRGEFALLRRPVDKIVGSAAPVSASATFEDGRLVLILAVSALVRLVRPMVAHPTDHAPSERPIRVLVIDDSAVVRDLMAEILSHAGLEVRLASGGEEALSIMRDDGPDVVLLDIDMPKMDGFEVLRHIRAGSDVPVIMLTLRASVEDRRRAASLGATAYVVKSQFQETTLVDTIRRFTAGR